MKITKSNTTSDENDLMSNRKKKLKFDDEEELIFRLSPYSKTISKRLHHLPRRPPAIVPNLELDVNLESTFAYLSNLEMQLQVRDERVSNNVAENFEVLK